MAVLAGLLRGDDIDALVEAVAPSHVRGWFTPDVAVLELAVAALDLACLPGAELLEYEGLRERYLPEAQFRGRVEHRSSQYALYAAACLRGGLQPDLLNDAGWWQTPLWIYAVHARVIYARAAADRRGATRVEIVPKLAVRHGLVDDVDQIVRADDPRCSEPAPVFGRHGEDDLDRDSPPVLRVQASGRPLDTRRRRLCEGPGDRRYLPWPVDRRV